MTNRTPPKMPTPDEVGILTRNTDLSTPGYKGGLNFDKINRAGMALQWLIPRAREWAKEYQASGWHDADDFLDATDAWEGV